MDQIVVMTREGKVMAREASQDDKLQAWSWPELLEGIQHAATELRRPTRGIGRALSHGPLMNAVVLWFLKQPPERQAEIAKSGKRGLEWLKQSDIPRNLDDPKLDEVMRSDKTAAQAKELERGKNAKRA
jgi:hypothetical protein